MQKILRGEQTQAAAEAELQRNQGQISSVAREDRSNILQQKEQVVKTKQYNTTSSVAPLNLEVVVSQPQIPQEQNKRDRRLTKMFERLNTSNSNHTERSHRDIITSQSKSKIATKQDRLTKQYSTQTITKTVITKTWVPGTIEHSTINIETEGLEGCEIEDQVAENGRAGRE